MEKTKYDDLEVEVIKFDSEDVITTSCQGQDNDTPPYQV